MNDLMITNTSLERKRKLAERHLHTNTSRLLMKGLKKEINLKRDTSDEKTITKGNSDIVVNKEGDKQ